MKTVIAASSAYNKKYFFNGEFASMPKGVQDEIRILCTLFTEKCGGIFTLGYVTDGSVFMEAEKAEDDLDYDEIGARLETDRLQKEKSKFFHSLSLWFAAFKTEDGKSIIEEMKTEGN